MAYQRPGVTVDQNITITPTSIEREQPAFIFGPNYELHRYSNADEKQKTAVGTYDGSKMEVEYPYVIDDEKVDKGYTKLNGDNVVVGLADLGSATLIEASEPEEVRAKNGGYTKLLFENKVYLDYDIDGKDAVRDSILPANLAAGDAVLVDYTDDGGSHTVRTTIVGVGYSKDPWDIYEGSSSSPEGAPGTLIDIEDAIPEGVEASSVSVRLVAVLQNVDFPSKAEWTSNGGYEWIQDEITLEGGKKVNGVVVNANMLKVVVGNYFPEKTWCPVYFADLFVTYRELITSYSDTFHSVVGASEVANVLGKVDPENPLAMGVYMAALNAATDDGDETPPVYFMAVPYDDAAGYSAVLNKATLNDRAYIFAPTTRDEAVLELVRSHVLEMSGKTVKKWRIAAASADVPEYVSKLSSADNIRGKDYFAIPIADNGSMEPGLTGGVYHTLRVVQDSTSTTGNTGTKFRSTLVQGDKVRFGYWKDGWGEVVNDTYTVKKVINNNTIEVYEAIDTTHIDPMEAGEGETPESYEPSKIEVYHPYSTAEYAEVVASASRQMASRRMLNVFPTQFKNDGVQMSGEFAACAVAGLVSATEPQQPITNVTVRGIDDIPLVYQQYSAHELDVMASGGTFIVAQDLPGDKVYVRHQITTAYPDGNLNTAELSITKNVDSISYAFAETFRPYYGKYNIVPGLIAILENLATQLIDQFAGSDSVYGPQLIVEETTILFVRQNALMKDHVDIGIRLGVPYPCNNIDIVLTV